MSGRTFKEAFRRWLDGGRDLTEDVMEGRRGHDLPRQDQRRLQREAEEIALARMERVVRSERRVFSAWYRVAAVACCFALMAVFLYMAAHITRYGAENPRAAEVAERYIERGLEETGAVNIVSGMILDYRAFDTLGESHVLFTALICVMVLLRRDRKNMRTAYEDYYRIREENYFPVSNDPIARRVGGILTPCILLFGIYILLNGQISPGGGFSGGAALGAGLVIFASTRGDNVVDRFMTRRVFQWTAFFALSFYSFAKGYVFFMGANHLENHIPKGTPGAILSGGLIPPLDIAVGLVVACTMFGFYSLFRRGIIGGDDAEDAAPANIPQSPDVSPAHPLQEEASAQNAASPSDGKPSAQNMAYPPERAALSGNPAGNAGKASKRRKSKRKRTKGGES
jgi:multicomponent Na+:H+ antiporter subunit B